MWNLNDSCICEEYKYFVNQSFNHDPEKNFEGGTRDFSRLPHWKKSEFTESEFFQGAPNVTREVIRYENFVVIIPVLIK